jgi:glycosyltransferase involved in cell wall biosynthesis
MRIGIDATALPPQLSGAGNYIVNLTNALVRLDNANEYVLFVKPIHRALFVPNERVQIDSVDLTNRIQRVAWEQMVLPRLARQSDLSVLHSPHYTMPLTLGCASVVTFHDMTFFLYPAMHKLYKRFFFCSMIHLSARRASALIADSESTRQDIVKILKLDASKVTTVPLGVSPSYRPIDEKTALERIKSKYHLPDKFVLYIGMLEPRKDLPTLVRAFKTLIEQGSMHKLVIVGRKGWMYDDLFRSVASLDLTERVVFTGYVPEEDLPLLYNAADVFVYPSIYEGFGLPVLEALACGTPVITSNISSMPEILGEAGILVKPEEADGLADAMSRVTQDGELRKRLVRQGLERAKLFTWDRAAQATLAVYERAVSVQ